MSFSDSQTLTACKLTISLVAGNNLANSVLWSHDDTKIFTSNGSHILVFDTESGVIIHRFTRHVDDVIVLIVNPSNSQQLLSTSIDGITHVWDINDFSHLLSIDFSRKIHTFTSNKDSTYILFGNGDVMKFPTKIFSNQGQEKLHKYLTSKPPTFTSKNSQTLLLYTNQGQDHLITYDQKNLVIFATHKQELHCYEKSQTITCVAVSANTPTLAYGTLSGRIYIWHNFISGDENITRLHWHSHSVISLAFNCDGTYLMSGGEESVLVVWQIDTLKRQFRPRIGGEIRRIVTSNTDQYISVVTSDNVMKVFNSSNLELAFISKNLKHTPWPFGMTACQNLDSLVLHSSPPGWIQVFHPVNQTRQFDIDVTALNVVSRPQQVQLNYMLVTHVAISHDGLWMITCESRYDKREAFRELRLRFWYYNSTDKSYEQIMCVDRPHRAVCMISFSPVVSDPICATCGEEGDFRIWTLAEGKIAESPSRLWQCYATNSLFSSKASHCVFSPDAALLAVAYKNCISIWKIETVEHKYNLEAEQLKDYIRSLVFSYSGRDSYILASTMDSVIVWDVLSCVVKWSVRIANAFICTSPHTQFAVTISNDNILVFDPQVEKPIIELNTGVDSRVIDACFLGQGNSLAVYFFTEKQQIFCLHDVNELDFKTKNTNPPLKPDSLFSDLLIGPTYTPYVVEDTRLFKKADLSIFNTPCHVLPATKTYAWNVISAFLQRRDSTEKDDIEPKTEEIQVDSMDTDQVDRYVEHKVNGVCEEDGIMDFNWLDSFFRSSEFVLT